MQQEFQEYEIEVDDKSLSDDPSIINYQKISHINIETTTLKEAGQEIYQVNISNSEDLTIPTLKFTNLEELEEFIQKCSNLETIFLNIKYPEATKLMEVIPSPDKLKSLLLLYEDTKVDLDKIIRFPNLISIYVGGAVNDITFLENIPHLQCLILDDAQIDNMKIVGQLKELKELTIHKSSIEELGDLKEITTIERLDVSYNEDLKNISGISNLKNLKSLNISQTNVVESVY